MTQSRPHTSHTTTRQPAMGRLGVTVKANNVTVYPAHHTVSRIENQAISNWHNVPVVQLDAIWHNRICVFLWALLTRAGILFFDCLGWSEPDHVYRDGLGAWAASPSERNEDGWPRNSDFLVEVNHSGLSNK